MKKKFVEMTKKEQHDFLSACAKKSAGMKGQEPWNKGRSKSATTAGAKGNAVKKAAKLGKPARAGKKSKATKRAKPETKKSKG